MHEVEMKKLALLSLICLLLLSISVSVSSQKQKKDDCSQYFGRGYCVDHIQNKVGRRPRGNASTWPANVKDNYQVQVGDTAIFRSAAAGVGHVAYVERVNSKNGRPFSIDVSEMNWGRGLDACSRTDKFGVVASRNNIPISSVSGFWRP